MLRDEQLDDYDHHITDRFGTVRDGARVKVPMALMDSVQRAVAGVPLVDAAMHRPGIRVLDNHSRDDVHSARATMVHDVGNAWRRDAAAPDLTNAAPPAPAPTIAPSSAYEESKRSLSTAWMKRGRRPNPAAAANAVEAQLEHWRGKQ